MRVVIYRSEVRGADVPEFSFSPIEANESTGVVGSGSEPWKVVEVAYGSRVQFSRKAGEPVLLISGEPSGLTAREAAERFGG